jgi:hypothetical protein
MHNTTFALTVLALFTTADRAAEIEGDLLEQSRSRGRVWFWLHVKLTCVALFFYALRQETGKLLLFSYAIYELGLKLSWWVLIPVTVTLRRSFGLDIPHETLHDFVIAPCAFGLGMLITHLSPKHGGSLVLLAGGLLFGRVTLLDGVPDAVRLVGFALLPAVLGALLMKWMELHRTANVTGFPLSRE